MKIAFRTDATSQIGTGHFMRCITLAEKLKKHGVQIRFVSRDLPVHLREMLAAKGMAYAPLSSEPSAVVGGDLAHAQWLGTSQAEDAQATIQALSGQQWDWIVIDHYALDVRWEKALRASTKKIMVIDDIADRQHDCDVLLDQNFYADMYMRYEGKVPVHCQQMLGPHYALLRDEFRKLREQAKPRTGSVKRILVFFGGVDAANYCGLAIEAFAGLALNGVQLDVVIGAQHPKRSAIEASCVTQGYFCHVQTTQMAALMARADLVIGAGGIATWERCCLGLPAFSFCVADNQRKQIVDAAEAGLLYAPSSDSALMDMIRRHTKTLLENPSLLKLISTAGMKAVDGKGTTRICHALGVYDIEIRPANESDSQKLFKWRNHPSIRAVSRNNTPIAWEEHQRWFCSVLADKNRDLLIGTIENESVGVVRFDKEGDVAEVSIYLVPDGGFAGQGRNLLLRAEQWLKANRPEITAIRAGVLGENEASNNLFLGTNYCTHTIIYLKNL